MKKGANNTYFGDIKEGIKSSLQGLKLSFQHLLEARESHQPKGVEDASYFEQETGVVTLKYPYEAIPVPDTGRYRLHNEIDDCIVCDKCAKACPVNCIEIEPVKAIEEVGKTSDGSSKRLYAAKFDIDMAKCCFCGLCTTVCPTECLTMTKAYDFSEFDVRNMVYHFSDLSPAEAEVKKKEYEEVQMAKQAAKEATKASAPVGHAAKPAEANTEAAEAPVKKPFRPIIKKAPADAKEVTPAAESPAAKDTDTPPSEAAPQEQANPQAAVPAPAKKPMRPIIRKPVQAKPATEVEGDETANAPSPSSEMQAENTVLPGEPDTIAQDKIDASATTPSTGENPATGKSEEAPTDRKKQARPIIRKRPSE